LLAETKQDAETLISKFLSEANEFLLQREESMKGEKEKVYYYELLEAESTQDRSKKQKR
jgi:hypothetical protein